MNEFLNALQKKPGFISMSPATNDQIQQAEAQLGLTFSDDYKAYVGTYGSASFDGHELTGISAAPYLDVVLVTLEEREKYPEIPADWYVIEQLHIDDVSIWQSSSGEVFQLLPGEKPLLLGDSLVSYVKE